MILKRKKEKMKIQEIAKQNIEYVFDFQKSCYPQKLFMTDTVLAGSKTLSKISVSNYGHFHVEYITGLYETDVSNICKLSGKLIDGATSRPLFDDYIPLSLWATPGKINTNQLFYPLAFDYTFAINSDILFETVNLGTADYKFWLCFHGYRIEEAGALGTEQKQKGKK